MSRAGGRLAGALLGLTLGVPASAQVSAPPPGRIGPARWEIGAYGGLMSPRLPSGGAGVLPAAGKAITTSSPVFPGRQTPSWFFGDGASQVNDVNAVLGVASRLVPLDAAFATMRLDASTRAAAGVRIARTVTPRISIEVGLGAMPGSGGLGAEAQAAVESTRASFESAFSALLATGPFTGVSVKATAATVRGASREMAVTGAAILRLAPRESWLPYAVLGAGALRQTGPLPSVALDATYRFRISGIAPIDETDHVALRYDRRLAPVAVVGAGWTRDVSAGWAVCIDGRFFVGPATSRLRIDATPSFVRGDPAGFIESLTYPNIQFSNNSSTGRASTLGGPSLQGFDIFAGDRAQTRVLFTVGALRRF